ncbi:cupredoxin domain-containing protein [Agrococcus carbonis]|uniref:Copper binding protein, plastocyanin/azurin family n=1 Tax=Agrococcus carbonis TaxID=684552 RepID=A0A1H1KV91_9MICO|nr:plastocyanin/azurin family copper-binding protein [Agrococcus carbonis]SDR65705.1 Copper binding protein, plastocyanin/azurin family [Agrococcus carbonis]
MIRTRTTAAALLIAAALALTGCAGVAQDTDDDAVPATPSAATAGPASPGASDDDGDDDGDDDVTELVAMVGTEQDPEAYEIALLDDDGRAVTTLPAGDYELTFRDRSRMHNFHLTGPGDVDVATDVAGSDESTIEITLEPGTYAFVCDPHQGSMSGSLEVTG